MLSSTAAFCLVLVLRSSVTDGRLHDRAHTPRNITSHITLSANMEVPKYLHGTASPSRRLGAQLAISTVSEKKPTFPLFARVYSFALFYWDAQFYRTMLSEAFQDIRNPNDALLRRRFSLALPKIHVPTAIMDLPRTLNDVIDLLMIPSIFVSCIHIWWRWQWFKKWTCHWWQLYFLSKYQRAFVYTQARYYLLGRIDLERGNLGNIYRSALSHSEMNHLTRNVYPFLESAPKVLVWLQHTNGLPLWPLLLGAPIFAILFTALFDDKWGDEGRLGSGLSGVVCAVELASLRASGRSFSRILGELTSQILHELLFGPQIIPNYSSIGVTAHLGGAVFGILYGETHHRLIRPWRLSGTTWLCRNLLITVLIQIPLDLYIKRLGHKAHQIIWRRRPRSLVRRSKTNDPQK